MKQLHGTQRLTKILMLIAAGIYIATASVAWAGQDQRVFDAAAATKNDALKLLERLVNIDSGTFNERGLTAVSTIVIEQLQQAGAKIELFATPPALAKNIVATFSGTGKKRIMLLAHMDTVFADGSAAARPFHVENDRATGPGVMDDKGGVVTAISAMHILKILQFHNYEKITLLLTTNEETFSPGTRSLIEATAKKHDIVLNLEPGRPADGLVIWRKGAGVVQVDVKGKSAHAGVAPESGRNAATEIAHQVIQLGTLGNKQTQTTVNVTVIKAGDRTNVIPDTAVAQADIRVAVPEEYDRVESDLSRLAANRSVADAQVTATLSRGSPPMQKNAQTDSLAALAQRIYSELGRSLTLEGSGGAADANFTAGMGIPTLDGFGIVGGNIHTESEYAEVSSIVPRFYLLTRMIMELAR